MILGICGRAGSGKDTVADILVRDHGFVKIAIADPLKRVLKDVFHFSDDQLWGPSKLRDAPDPRYPRTVEARAFIARAAVEAGAAIWPTDWLAAIETEFGEGAVYHFLTPRRAAQRLGTEFGRECYSDVWIDKALSGAVELTAELSYHNSYTAQGGFWYVRGVPRPRGVVISDVRFPNEVAAIRAKGGHLWRTVHGRGLEGAAGEHESEQHIARLEADAEVPDSTLEALPVVITTMLKEILR